MKKKTLIIAITTTLALSAIFIFYACKKVDLSRVTKCNVETITVVNATTVKVEVDVFDLSSADHPDYGICYSATNVTPTIADGKASMGAISEYKKYSKNIENLTAGTKYYFRGYVMNGSDAKYSFNIKDATPAPLPTATTTAATNVAMTSTTINATINANGTTSTITFEYGITASYGQAANASPATVTGNANTNVSANITGLTANSTYHFRVKAACSAGSVYGSDLTFATSQTSVSTLTTTTASSITSTTATSGGNVTNDGGTTVTTRGVCWSTSSNPIATGNHTIDGTGTGTFTSSITGLSASTLYYVRAYATNSAGTAYGNEISFTSSTAIANCGTVTDADGNVYNTVTIGTKCWMRENLKTTKYRDGTAIPNVTDNAAWSALTTGAYSDYNNTPSNSDTYGRLYNWYAATDAHNLCPTNWHVPSDGEWNIMEKFLDSSVDTTISGNWTGTDIGGKLKETGTSHWNSPNTGATNSSGFGALPGGYRSSNGTYYIVGDGGYWWSASAYGASIAWIRYLGYGGSQVYRYYFDKTIGFSVRCVRDF